MAYINIELHSSKCFQKIWQSYSPESKQYSYCIILHHELQVWSTDLKATRVSHEVSASPSEEGNGLNFRNVQNNRRKSTYRCLSICICWPHAKSVTIKGYISLHEFWMHFGTPHEIFPLTPPPGGKCREVHSNPSCVYFQSYSFTQTWWFLPPFPRG
jgi:hypothetical protein